MPDLKCGCRLSKDRRRTLRLCGQHRASALVRTAPSPASVIIQDYASWDTGLHVQGMPEISLRKSRGTSRTGAIGDTGITRATENRPYPKDDVLHADIRDGHVHTKGYAPAYRAQIGPTPKVRAGLSMPDKLHIARSFLRKIEAARDSLADRLTKSESTRLYRLERIWALRAAGKDATYLAVGNYPLGLSQSERRSRLRRTSW